MPKPVPPPPPQPSAEETVVAVRLVRILSLVAIAFFALLTLTYGNDSWIVHYGRNKAISWNFWRMERLDFEEYRQHSSGRIVWLVGSSILRESFDERAINKALRERDSEWRVLKFGVNAGAPGIAWGLLKRLPIREGDRVMHVVQMENFQKDWIEHSLMPPWMIAMMLSPMEIWQVEEWSVQEKLEQSVAIPHDFYSYREEYMNGLILWMFAPFDGPPRWRKRSYHLRFHEFETASRLDRVRRQGERSRYYIDDDEADFSEGQFNMQGLSRLRRHCAERGAELTLLDVPSRQEYYFTMMTPGVHEQWDAWINAQPEVAFFPQVPEDAYYDLQHPNYRGRAVHSQYLIEWLEEPERGERAIPEWPLPGAPGSSAPSDGSDDGPENDGPENDGDDTGLDDAPREDTGASRGRGGW